MDRHGQFTFIRFLVILLFFAIIWAIGISAFVSNMASEGIAQGGVTGIEAFFLTNFNLWILIAIILCAFVIVYKAGSGP